jgi:hypothetical protein
VAGCFRHGLDPWIEEPDCSTVADASLDADGDDNRVDADRDADSETAASSTSPVKTELRNRVTSIVRHSSRHDGFKRIGRDAQCFEDLDGAHPVG